MAGVPENPEVAIDNDLKRALGPVHLIALGIGAIIGAGIFVITGHAAATFAGPAVVISFAIAGTGCLFAGLCYAEYASMIPVAGSAYTYTFATMGKFMAWFIGWNLVLEYLAAASTVAVGWSGYFSDFMKYLGYPIPHAFASAPLCVATDMKCPIYNAAATGIDALHHLGTTGTYFNLPAVALIALVTFVLIVGVHLSANFNNAMVAIKLCIVVLVIAVGLPHVVAANHTPFVPANTGTWGHFGYSGVLRATGVIFFAYIGFDAVSVAAQEARNPQRDIPLGILGSLAICTVLYMLMSYVLTGLASYTTLNVDHPVSQAAEALRLHALACALYQCGRHRGSRLRGAGADPRSIAHLLCDGERRDDPAHVLRRASALPHAMEGHAGDGLFRGAARGRAAARHPGRTRLHRHAPRLRHRVPGCDDPAGDAAPSRASVPRPGGVGRGPTRDDHVRRDDVLAAVRYLAASGGMDNRSASSSSSSTACGTPSRRAGISSTHPPNKAVGATP